MSRIHEHHRGNNILEIMQLYNVAIQAEQTQLSHGIYTVQESEPPVDQRAGSENN